MSARHRFLDVELASLRVEAGARWSREAWLGLTGARCFLGPRGWASALSQGNLAPPNPVRATGQAFSASQSRSPVAR
jgi:hypothetical protein